MKKKSRSITWNAIMKTLSVLKDGFEFRLGDGNSSFSFFNWSKVGKLANRVLYVDIHNLEMRVNNVYLDGNLNFNLLYTNIPPAVCERLKALLICLNSLVPNWLTWKENLDDIYTARGGYN